MNTIPAKDILTGNKFLIDGREYTADGYAQLLSGGWVRIPLVRWRLSDPRAVRLRKNDPVLRVF